MSAEPSEQIAESPQLQYQSELEAKTGCMRKLCGAFSEAAYRLVHGDIRHADNFKPTALINPQLLNKEHLCCSLWGLSMFETHEQLKSHVQKVIKTNPNFQKRTGDHYAVLALGRQHGRRTLGDPRGHFDFYPFVGIDPKSAVTKHEILAL